MFCLETSSWSSSFKTRIVKKSLPGLFGVNGTRHGTYSALRQSKVAGCEDWNAPPRDFVKFNIDCVVRSNFGLTGIGGLLRDHSGKVLAEFSKSIGYVDPASGEIMTIK